MDVGRPGVEEVREDALVCLTGCFQMFFSSLNVLIMSFWCRKLTIVLNSCSRAKRMEVKFICLAG